MARDYKREYRKFHASIKAKKARAQRNRIRRELEKAGRVSKGDGKEGDHKKSKKNGGSDRMGNIRVVSRKKNRKKGTKNAGV